MSQDPQLTRSVDDPEGASISIATRIRRALAVPGRMIAALFVRDRTMPRAVAAEKSAAPLVAAILCAGLCAFVIGSRLDLTRTVLDREVMKANVVAKEGGEVEEKSDREIAEE